MKFKPSLAGFFLGAATLLALAASVKISDLPLAPTPTSTNTYIEIADMNAATKSLKTRLPWTDFGTFIAPTKFTNLVQVGSNGVLNVGGAYSVVSQFSDTATNAALVVDTATPWIVDDEEKLVSLRNNGTNVAYITQHGAIEIGRSVVPYWAPDKSDFITGIHDAAAGEPTKSYVVFQNIDDAASVTNFNNFQVTLDLLSSATSLSLVSINGVENSFNFTVTTNANRPLVYKADGVEKFALSKNGSTTQGGAAIAPEVDASELYTGSFKLYRGTLTPIDAGTSIDFGSTNRYWSCTLTGNVTFATANLAAGKHANIMITGVATNATYTWPAGWVWIGYKPSYLTANKHADLYLKATSGADSGVWCFYGEEQ